MPNGANILAYSTPMSQAQRPNVAIILIDDAGFAATSLYGGVARTPAFEALAREGLRYNRFHVTAVCAPSRAALLSGRNPHQVGFGSIPELAVESPGYNSIWPKSAASIATLLKQAGYGTAAFGKWHNTPAWEWSPVGPFDHWPTGLGFEHFYGTIGTTSNWEPLLWRDTTAVPAPKTAEKGYYLTTDLVDDAIGWLHTRESLAPDRPYFMYFATTATHAPHQVAESWVTPYRGAFDAGWDALRLQIFERQKRLGVIPKDAQLNRRPSNLPAWNSLTPPEKTVAERQMEILAGYMAQTDHEIGRLIEAIRKGPDGSNTLIMLILGDNGSSGDDGLAGCDDCPLPPPDAAARLPSLGALAGPNHISGSAAGWAFMNDTPFQGMKRQASHLGGTRVPLIISWPGHTENNDEVRSQWIDVTDVAATLYDVLGITPPAMVDGVTQLPMAGTSFAASFARPDAPSTHRVQYFETFGSRAIYQDGWMASLRYLTPWDLRPVLDGKGPEKGAANWELYNLDADFSQSHDLAARYPDKLAHLVTLFGEQARANQVYPIGTTYDVLARLPSLSRKRRDFVFYPDIPIIAWDALPNFRRGYSLSVSITLKDSVTNGLLVSDGNRGRGFALYMQDGRIVFESERVGQPSRLVTAASVIAGRHEIVVDVSKAPTEDGGGPEKRHVSIRLDGQQVAQRDLPDEDAPFYGGATLSIGTQRVSPVSPAAPPPFSGTIGQVRVRYTSPE